MRLSQLIFISLFVFSIQGHTASEILKRSKRVQLTEQADLKKELSSMDELDQDMFFLHLKNQLLSKVQEEYPQIPSSKLIRVQRSVQALR